MSLEGVIIKIENIKKKLEIILGNYDILIYSINKKREFGEKILEILLKGKNITTTILEEIHVKLLEQIEEDFADDYYLELSSLGAEYDLENFDELKENINKYLYIETLKFKAICLLIDLDFENKTLILSYNEKGRIRKIKIEYDACRRIRTSVKV